MRGKEFEKLIIGAVEVLPAHIREKIKNVAFVIDPVRGHHAKSRATTATRRSASNGVEKRPRKKITVGALTKTGECLLGLYEGVPLTAWGRDFGGKLPDKITIFQEPIERLAGSPEEVPRIVRETVWHEIGHYFGLGHKRLRMLEKRWRSTI